VTDDDPQIRRGYEWFLNLMDKKQWEKRKQDIQGHLREVARPFSSLIGSEEFRSVSVPGDRFGWYQSRFQQRAAK
jgi:hypothetical protein